MLSKFDPELPLVTGPLDLEDDNLAAGLSLGPCAMGPATDGKKLTSVQVVIVQTVGDKRAVATGRSGELVRAGAPRPPFEGHWRVNTRLEPGSDPFVAGPAHAAAVAIAVTDAPQPSIEVERWDEHVRIVGG